MDLKTPIKDSGRIFKMFASRLEKLGIKTLEDFLYHIPSRYDDFSLISKIKHVQAGETVTIQGTVIEFKNELTKNFKRLQKAKIADETGEINIIWFNQPYLLRIIQKGNKISLSGKIGWFLREKVMESPEYEVLTQNYAEAIPGTVRYGASTEPHCIHTARLVPVYPETKGISSKWIRRQTYNILHNQTQNMFEYLPDSIINNYDLIGFKDAINQIHYPNTFELADKAKQRLAFDELFLMQLSAFKRRSEWEKKLIGIPFSIDKFQKEIEEFWKNLPFELTNSQKKAVSEILKDLSSKKPMNRLLEGDVGSGKTVVGAIAMYIAFLNGFQSILMAPTEILAQQHYKTISNLLTPLGAQVDLVTGSKKLKIENLKLKILIGTHALLSEKIKLDNLGLVIIDEQQRFGVEQRALIKQKGKNPHLLTMTATPIPRTVALTMYGDLNLSYLDEMPKGRRTVKTWLVPEEKRTNAYKWIISELSTSCPPVTQHEPCTNSTQKASDKFRRVNSQLFIICPFIEESENMQTIKAAAKEFERLKKEIFPNLKLGLLHGKLKSKEKDKVLQKFKYKELDILVATPVVEVGIDIPNATIIIIEAAERFGLAQLHQLRGRVGRGDKQSYCLLFTESKNYQTIQRLKAMETMHNGAELAEFDLKLRGPGELYGTSQHGIPKLKVATFSDFTLIEKAKKEAEKIFPELSNHPLLEEKIKSITIEKISHD